MVQKLISPSKHAGSDPETFRLRPVMAITASVQPQSGRIVHAGSDFPQPFQFRFSKEGMDHTVQKQQQKQQQQQQNRIRTGWPGQGLAKCIWSGSKPNASGLQESSGPLLANASQPIRTGCESDPACLLSWFTPRDGRQEKVPLYPTVKPHCGVRYVTNKARWTGYRAKSVIVFQVFSTAIRAHRYTINTSTFISEVRSCVNVEVAVLPSPSLISLMVSADIKQH